jgi:hypothetical protein
MYERDYIQGFGLVTDFIGLLELITTHNTSSNAILHHTHSTFHYNTHLVFSYLYQSSNNVFEWRTFPFL